MAKAGLRDIGVRYDGDSDILYLHFKDGPSHELAEAGENVILELDEHGRVMGVEIWDAAKRGLLDRLRQLLPRRRGHLRT